MFDARAYAESALQAAHQLESLSNQAVMLANQAHALAASPYSNLAQTTQTLTAIGQLAQSATGIAANVTRLQSQFQTLYPAAVQGATAASLLQQAQGRTLATRNTAQDLAATAAQLEQLSQGRAGRVSGAVSAAQSAQGPTAAAQASAQLLAALSEDLGSLRAVTLAQARLAAAEAADRSAEQTASAELHRQLWAHDAATPPNPNFNPYSHAKN
ncbi:MAG: conjugal transfer protein TrbJ [Proteobacteria bacterium]|nr:conjugal transfer protein TrbJ [Pseudomonadota bacterium]